MSQQWKTRIGWAITAVAALPFVPSAWMKLKGDPQVIEGMAKMGFPDSMRLPLGVLELVCLVLYLFPQTAVLGAVLLTGYLGGAICTHWRAGESVIFPALLGGVVWLGIYLREPRLWPLLPWRKPAA